ncbi:uncharacterized protein LACBIDRAFT_309574 [Laccaria bicolor S238N-H82]|uniref:Predicted protein n=1 Tax=Laccaria bicolor (strain S238N-H82 / ATCC MYA-4686) TaxID=486041 RepID=B0E4R1_LACBS|nr:uncharacterized protein LACBIDRAFT_309574 [Laccaria bicolor S238N-H82]EDQ98170.1 predicted protein [Laccaria bicolor S238N-H82]|eukprot:XP_001891179.1 predicted protein [Laccaria bicolor S238N-H82]
MGGQGKRDWTGHEKSQFATGGSGDFHDEHAANEVSPIGGGKNWEMGAPWARGEGRVISRGRVRRSHDLSTWTTSQRLYLQQRILTWPPVV